MTVTITPGAARGAVCAPPSKSCGHRMLLCAALAAGESRIRGISRSQDMAATLDCIRAMGGSARLEGDTAHITGTGGCAAKSTVYPCRESGSTLRFCIPPALVPGGRAVFTGAPRLLERGIGIYEDVLPRAGIRIEKCERCIALEGALTAGEYTLRGDVSSQFITGLLLALPRLGVQVDEWDENCFFIPGQQHYAARVAAVEGDWSNAAFLLALGEGITVTGLRAESLQGDRVCRDMLRRLQSPGAQLDLTACPDLGPVLFAAAARAHGAVFTGTRRLRIKESDRVAAMAQELAKLGVRVDAEENRVTVHPGGIAAPREVLDGHNDHRIVMALSVLATSVGGTIRGAEAVAKSYPDFFEVLQALGIRAEIRP